MREEKRAQAGFTLIEVLVVIVVIGILAGLSMVSLLNALDRAKQRATMADMRTVSRALEAYTVDNHGLPDDSGGLTALIPVMVPYATNVLPTKDHWGHDILYSTDATGNYTLQSWGKDGVDGADVTAADRFDYNLDLVMFNGLFTAAPE